MVDIGWSEMLAIAVILIVVVGPKDLPQVLRAIGKVVRKVRGMADEFRRGVDEFMRESELKDIKDGVQQVKNFNLDRLKAETERNFDASMNQTVDPSSSSGSAASSDEGSSAPQKAEPAKASGTDDKDA
jgi:sec-independent protein translocase protein TatB